MSGFLRQLASRSLGLAPRLRSAPTPQAAALQGPVSRQGAAGDAPGLADARAQAAAFAPAWDARASDGAAGGPAHGASLHRPAAGPGRAAPAAPPAPDRHAGMADSDTPRGRSMPPASADAAMPPPLVARGNGSDDFPPAHRADSPPGTLSGIRMAEDARAGLAAEMEGDGRGPARPLAPTRAGRDPGDPRDSGDPGQSGESGEPGRRDDPAGHGDPASRRAAIDTDTLAALAVRASRRALGDFAAATRHAPQSAPDVHITIDRLEVAPPAPVPRAAPPARSAALSLRAYLAARRSGLP